MLEDNQRPGSVESTTAVIKDRQSCCDSIGIRKELERLCQQDGVQAQTKCLVTRSDATLGSSQRVNSPDALLAMRKQRNEMKENMDI